MLPALTSTVVMTALQTVSGTLFNKVLALLIQSNAGLSEAELQHILDHKLPSQVAQESNVFVLLTICTDGGAQLVAKHSTAAAVRVCWPLCHQERYVFKGDGLNCHGDLFPRCMQAFLTKYSSSITAQLNLANVSKSWWSDTAFAAVKARSAWLHGFGQS